MKKKDFKQISAPKVQKPFSKMSSAEAEEFFDWHMKELPNRLHNMGEALDFELSYTPESLAELWKKLIQYHQRNSLKLRLSSRKRAEFDSLISCAGLYLAEVFIENNPGISWACNTNTSKNDFFYNKPVLVGFRDRSISPPFNMFFEPYHMIDLQAVKIVNARIAKENDLIELYNKWCEHI